MSLLIFNGGCFAGFGFACNLVSRGCHVGLRRLIIPLPHTVSRVSDDGRAKEGADENLFDRHTPSVTNLSYRTITAM